MFIAAPTNVKAELTLSEHIDQIAPNIAEIEMSLADLKGSIPLQISSQMISITELNSRVQQLISDRTPLSNIARDESSILSFEKTFLADAGGRIAKLSSPKPESFRKSQKLSKYLEMSARIDQIKASGTSAVTSLKDQSSSLSEKLESSIHAFKSSTGVPRSVLTQMALELDKQAKEISQLRQTVINASQNANRQRELMAAFGDEEPAKPSAEPASARRRKPKPSAQLLAFVKLDGTVGFVLHDLLQSADSIDAQFQEVDAEFSKQISLLEGLSSKHSANEAKLSAFEENSASLLEKCDGLTSSHSSNEAMAVIDQAASKAKQTVDSLRSSVREIKQNVSTWETISGSNAFPQKLPSN